MILTYKHYYLHCWKAKFSNFLAEKEEKHGYNSTSLDRIEILVVELTA